MSRLIRPSRKKACANCLHFACNGTAYVHRPLGGIYRVVGEQARGDCRVKPPGRDKTSGAAMWPDVLGNEWCGAFEPRRSASKKEAA